MKLVILGAGASFDHINYYYGDEPDLSWRPPLANEIFDARLNFRNIIQTYPGSNALMSELNVVSDIEEYFQNRWNFVQNNRADELLTNLINVQYFMSHLFYEISIQNRFIGNSNYDILVQHAYEYSVTKKEDVAFVNFNYDLFMEDSLCKTYSNKETPYFTEIDEYIKNPIKLFKMHGSCNWFKPIKIDASGEFNMDIANHLYEKKHTYATINKLKESKHVILTNPTYRNNPSEKCSYFPEILVPFKDKDEFVLPDSHLEKLKQILPKVTDIMIIGWKGSEDMFKKLLLNCIGDKKVNVLCINGESPEDSKTIISSLFNNANITHFSQPYYLQKVDNTNVNFRTGVAQSSTILHTSGSFSSYTLNVIKKKYEDFFAI